MKHTIKHIYSFPLAALLAIILPMCSPSVPKDAASAGRAPKISPDYADIEIPANIAPLNFCIDEKGSDFITRFYTDAGAEMVVGGKVLDIDVDRWHELLASAKGANIYAEVFAKQDGRWMRHDPIQYTVAEEIDPYISYRYLEPLYVNYEVMRICQRCLENFDETEIYNNCGFLNPEGDRQCVNCHSYQDYNRGGNMQMHLRVTKGGTVIVRDGHPHKVNLKVGDLWSVGQYPSWHPTEPLIAYSINDTWQHFHSAHTNKVEVQDGASDLILYDVEANAVSYIANTQDELETFPYWSPDGQWLYYASASVPPMTREEMANYRMINFRDIKYNILRRPFDKASRTFGPVDTVFNAAAVGMSATFPRINPADPRQMVFTMGEFGTFHNFHADADLYELDLLTGEVRPIDALNSMQAESYHSFSSNGKWLIFSSKRENGSYTRLYLAHVGPDGAFGKPFLLPQQSPFAGDLLFKCYNVPEFMADPVTVTRAEWAEAIEADPADATFN